MSTLWSKAVHQLDPYVPGEQPKLQNLIKLNTNENPYPPAPGVQQFLNAYESEALKLYPDPNSQSLKQVIAQHFDLDVTQVFVGNGSDEVLAHAFKTFFENEAPILFPDISYSFYPVYCGLFQIDFVKVPLSDSFDIDPDGYKVENGGIIFPNPNAPTSKLLALGEIETILLANPESVVIVDEAYIDFGGHSAVSLINQYPNLLVIQTLSKSRSLAGIRLGYALGHQGLIEGLERVKNSFNSYPINRLSEGAALASFADESYFAATCQKVMDTRDRVTAELEQLGFKVLPSAANFVFAKPEQFGFGADEIFSKLRQKNIIVRYFDKPRISEYLRITIGTDEQMQSLLDALKSFKA